MSRFQFISYGFGMGMVGQGLAYAMCCHTGSAAASIIVGLAAIITSGFCAAAGEE